MPQNGTPHVRQMAGADDDTEEKLHRLHVQLDEVARRRAANRVFGEVTVKMVWVEGRLKEFRIIEEQINR